MKRVLKAKASGLRTFLLIFKMIIIIILATLGFYHSSQGLLVLASILGFIIITSIIAIREHTLVLDDNNLIVVRHGYFGLFRKELQFSTEDIQSLKFIPRKDIYFGGMLFSRYAWELMFPSGNSKVVLKLRNNESNYFSCYADPNSLRRLFRFLNKLLNERGSVKL